MTNILYPSQNSQGQIEQYNKQYFTSNQAHLIFQIFFLLPSSHIISFKTFKILTN